MLLSCSRRGSPAKRFCCARASRAFPMGSWQPRSIVGSCNQGRTVAHGEPGVRQRGTIGLPDRVRNAHAPSRCPDCRDPVGLTVPARIETGAQTELHAGDRRFTPFGITVHWRNSGNIPVRILEAKVKRGDFRRAGRDIQLRRDHRAAVCQTRLSHRDERAPGNASARS